MVERVYVQEEGHGRLMPEMRDLAVEFQRRGFPVQLFTAKSMLRRRLELSVFTLVVAEIPIVLAALKQIGAAVPEPNDYPVCLEPFLLRRIWKSTVAAVRSSFLSRDCQPLFAKPAVGHKRFTGRVFTSVEDLSSLSGISGKLPVYCASVVRWLSESRVFVIGGRIAGVRPYAGDRDIPLDPNVVGDAVGVYERSGEAAAAYAIDFGVLEDGATALVEVNDGFAVGSYGLDPAVYADFILARWQEMVRTKSVEDA